MKKSDLLLLGLLCGVAQVYAENALEMPPILLGLGEQRLLKIPALKKYSLGNSTIARMTSAPQNGGNDAFLIKGVQAGSTDLWVWKQDQSLEHRTIHIEKWENPVFPKPLLTGLNGLREVEVIPTGKGALLRGIFYSSGEASRLHALLKNYPEQIQSEAQPHASLLDEIEKKIKVHLQNSKWDSSLWVERQGTDLWIRGSLPNVKQAQAVEKQVKTIYPFVLSEVSALPDAAPTLYFRVFLLEIKRDQFQSIGLEWPTDGAPAVQVTPWALQNLVNLEVTLKALSTQGEAKVLSKPELVVRAPGEAELFAGGEIPIRSQGRFFSNISWKPYGLSLKLKITHFGGRKVRFDIQTEVSHLDYQVATDSVPGTKLNRMKTQVDADLNRPLFLSGLLHEDMRKEAKGLPFLKDLPILGSLFGSDDYLNARSELVAILIPYLAPPAAPLNRVEEPDFPAGFVPPPRNWISPDDVRNAQTHPDYPWNVLE